MSAASSDTPGVSECAVAACASAVALAENTADTARAASAALRVHLAERPYATLAVVAGVGFVVAGGLAAPATRGVAQMGVRIALTALARKLVEVAIVEPRRE